MTDAFMEGIKRDTQFALINPRTRKTAQKVKARAVFDLIVHAAWRTGDPGLIFPDETNRRNPTPFAGGIEATNPCGELPLLAYESCNLSSINLSAFTIEHGVDWEKLKDRVGWAIRFLDDVIEVNKYPLPEIREITFANRKVGLFDYPALMAADILLYGTDLVPVGEDQKQHVELTREIARQFNSIYGNTFRLPKPVISELDARIMGLDEPMKKMSKSATKSGHAIFLLDPPEAIRRKVTGATTDSLREIRFDEKRPGDSESKKKRPAPYP